MFLKLFLVKPVMTQKRDLQTFQNMIQWVMPSSFLLLLFYCSWTPHLGSYLLSDCSGFFVCLNFYPGSSFSMQCGNSFLLVNPTTILIPPPECLVGISSWTSIAELLAFSLKPCPPPVSPSLCAVPHSVAFSNYHLSRVIATSYMDQLNVRLNELSASLLLRSILHLCSSEGNATSCVKILQGFVSLWAWKKSSVLKRTPRFCLTWAMPASSGSFPVACPFTCHFPSLALYVPQSPPRCPVLFPLLCTPVPKLVSWWTPVRPSGLRIKESFGWSGFPEPLNPYPPFLLQSSLCYLLAVVTIYSYLPASFVPFWV